MPFHVLGIESSCDETSAAVVEETGDAARPWAIRSNIIASQVAIHREWGGVVPELASRQHVRDICGVVAKAMDDAKVGWSDLDAVAVTQGPGLVGSLLVGLAFAKSAAAAAGPPPSPPVGWGISPKIGASVAEDAVAVAVAGFCTSLLNIMPIVR